jgi:hypothetical protein
MRHNIKKYFLPLFLAAFLGSCIKSYAPPSVVSANNNYLVVDGFINAGPNQASTFVLSRTRNLGDTSSVDAPELNATINIVSQSSGNSFPLQDTANTGTYSSAPMNLSTTDQYQLKIHTSNGDQYVSAFVPVKISAPIDSVTWNQNNNVYIFVNTHDPTNSSIYYKWDFVETWQHDAVIASYIQADNDTLIFSSTATPAEQTDSCWSSAGSNSLITGTSATLSQDEITQQPITTILQNDPKLAIRYSIQVRQIPLTLPAFNYWTLIEKNSQQLGTLFDPQPSELPGNIHSTIYPNEPVIGYVSAAAPQEKRLFINASQVSDWNAPPPINDATGCPIVYGIEPTGDFPFYADPYPDPSYTPFNIGGTGVDATLTLTKTECVECLFQGGTSVRPSFW